MIKGKQITIQVFVDNCILSSKRELDIEDLIESMNKEFRMKKKELTVTRAKLHEYLGITVDFSRKYCVSFTMCN